MKGRAFWVSLTLHKVLKLCLIKSRFMDQAADFITSSNLKDPSVCICCTLVFKRDSDVALRGEVVNLIRLNLLTRADKLVVSVMSP